VSADLLHLDAAETLRPEEYANRKEIKVAVLVQRRDRQVQIVVDPEGDGWDWAVSEYVRQAMRIIAKKEDQNDGR
jgi:hypothetical protein